MPIKHKDEYLTRQARFQIDQISGRWALFLVDPETNEALLSFFQEELPTWIRTMQEALRIMEQQEHDQTT